VAEQRSVLRHVTVDSLPLSLAPWVDRVLHCIMAALAACARFTYDSADYY
jgi:hypothetical protein